MKRILCGVNALEKANAQGNAWDTLLVRDAVKAADFQTWTIPLIIHPPMVYILMSRFDASYQEQMKVKLKSNFCYDYSKINWSEVELTIRKYQHDIARAAITYTDGDMLRDKQKLLIRSYEARVWAFRQVITNKGKNTAGIDGVILKKEDLPTIGRRLENLRSYSSCGVRRVFIPKSDGKLRPLGIPTQLDRVWQTLFSLALSPVVFSVNCPRSYGYIKGRSCRDAVVYLKTCLNQRKKSFRGPNINVGAQWVVEADIKGFFNNIDHD